MPAITTKDGTEIYYKDWGKGQPIVFSHGWPLSADDWDTQMMFFLGHGYRVIAHDRRGHGRSSQTADGHDMDHYADDLAAVTAHLRKLDRGSAQSPYAVAIEVSEIEWEGVRAAFHAELADVDRKSAGAHKPVTYYDGHAYKVQIDGGMAGAGVFYIDAARFRIPPGFHMVWRTLAGSGRIEE